MTELTNLIKLSKGEPMDHNDPKNSAVKPAFKSTEFWLQLAATVIGLLLMSGALDGKDPSIAKALVTAAAILAALGYTGARTSAKNKAVEGAAMIEVAKLGVDLANPKEPAAGP